MNPNMNLLFLSFIPCDSTFFEKPRIIASLFFMRGPVTIFLAVISVVINTIYRSFFFSENFYMPKIAFIHVISKFFKRFPKIFNTPSTISKIFMAVWIFTTGLKRHINIIKSLMTSTCKSMRIIKKSYGLSAASTAARLCSTTSQIWTRNYLSIATFTNAVKKRISLYITSHPFYNPQKAEFLIN